MEKLQPALNDGLDSGMTVNEIKEILVQMYAYAGFPRSLNGISTFMKVTVLSDACYDFDPEVSKSINGKSFSVASQSYNG